MSRTKWAIAGFPIALLIVTIVTWFYLPTLPTQPLVMSAPTTSQPVQPTSAAPSIDDVRAELQHDDEDDDDDDDEPVMVPLNLPKIGGGTLAWGCAREDLVGKPFAYFTEVGRGKGTTEGSKLRIQGVFQENGIMLNSATKVGSSAIQIRGYNEAILTWAFDEDNALKSCSISSLEPAIVRAVGVIGPDGKPLPGLELDACGVRYLADAQGQLAVDALPSDCEQISLRYSAGPDVWTSQQMSTDAFDALEGPLHFAPREFALQLHGADGFMTDATFTLGRDGLRLEADFELGEEFDGAADHLRPGVLTAVGDTSLQDADMHTALDALRRLNAGEAGVYVNP